MSPLLKGKIITCNGETMGNHNPLHIRDSGRTVTTAGCINGSFLIALNKSYFWLLIRIHTNTNLPIMWNFLINH